MHRIQLITKLENYNPEFEIEKEFRVRFLDFIQQNSNCFLRTLSHGHITGSSWIVNKSKDKFLMTHHAKLNKWLQLGGHADGESDIVKVATTEALEESGLQSIILLDENIFDIDIHSIPAGKQDPQHLHYDIRFLFEADDQEAFIVSNESNDLGWLTEREISMHCGQNDSITRMIHKTKKRALSPKLSF